MSHSRIEKIVYFVRHGQSEDNAAPVFQAPGSPLSEKGKTQAESIARRVANLSFEALVASPFQRAKETAEIIANRTGAHVEYSELFTERIKPTSVNGKPHTDEQASAISKEWDKSLHVSGMRVEDGENFDDIMHRVDNALAYLAQRPEKTIVVVTHGYFLRAVIGRVLLGDLFSEEISKRFHTRASMENTGLTVLRYQSKQEEESMWRLWIFNDHAHLG